MRPARALMFDFNGTLSADEPLLCSVYQSLFSRYGRPLPEERYYAELAGGSDDEIIGGWLGVDGPLLASLVGERIAAYADAAADGSTVSEVVREAVRVAAAHVPVAIVSSAFRAEIVPVVEAAGLATELTAIVAADDVTRWKPDPEAYVLAAETLVIAPADAVALEDTDVGIAAATGAGVRCVAVRGTMPDDRLVYADEIVDAIDVTLIRRLVGV